MKKILSVLFFITFVFILNAESKVDELLKSDKEIYKNMTIENQEKSVAKSGYIEKLKGEVFFQNEGKESWVQAVEKSVIKEKTTLITMEKANVKIKMSDGSFVNIGGRTKVYFEKMRGTPNKEELSETGIKLFWGKIYSNVKKKVESGGKYEIKTGSIVAGVRGTKFMVSALKSGENQVSVYEGIVYVRKIDEEIEMLINKNESIKLRSDGKFEEKREHNETPPEEEIKDDGIKNEITEIILKPETEKQEDIDSEREYTKNTIEDKTDTDTDKNGSSSTTLNIYIK